MLRERRSAARRSTAFLAMPAQRADTVTIACIYVAAVMVIPARLVLKGIPLSISPANLIGMALLALWFCAQLTTSLGAAKGRNPVRTAAFVYAFGLIATYGYAASSYLPADEMKALDRRIILAAALIGITVALCDGVRRRERLDLLLKVLVLGGAFAAFVGALQFLLDIDLTQRLVLPGLRFSTEDGSVFERADLRRVSGTTANPIEFGLVCASLLPLALHFGFQATARREPAVRWWVCSVLIASGLMFSVSRSAILGVAVAGTVLVLGWPARRRIQAAIAAVVFLVITKFTVPGLLGVFVGLFTNASDDPSIQFRTHDYPIVFAEVGRHVLLGRGLGTWVAPKHQILDNQYLLTLLETGVLGLVAFAGLFVAAIYATLRARVRSVEREQRDLGLAIAAAIAVPMAGAVTFDLLSFPTIAGLTFLLFGVAGAYVRCVCTTTVATVVPVAVPRTATPTKDTNR